MNITKRQFSKLLKDNRKAISLFMESREGLITKEEFHIRLYGHNKKGRVNPELLKTLEQLDAFLTGFYETFYLGDSEEQS